MSYEEELRALLADARVAHRDKVRARNQKNKWSRKENDAIGRLNHVHGKILEILNNQIEGEDGAALPHALSELERTGSDHGAG